MSGVGCRQRNRTGLRRMKSFIGVTNWINDAYSCTHLRRKLKGGHGPCHNCKTGWNQDKITKGCVLQGGRHYAITTICKHKKINPPLRPPHTF